MGYTPDKDICSHYNIPLCLLLSVLYVYATSTSLQIISCFIYSYFLRPVFQFQRFCIASKMTKEFFVREGVCWFQIAVVKCSRNSLFKEKKSPLHVVKRAEIWYPFSSRTYCTVKVENTWRTQWQGKLFSSHGTNHSCGVMVLIRSDLDFNSKSVEADVQGRYVLVEADVQGSNFLFVNVYAPNKVQEQCLFLTI